MAPIEIVRLALSSFREIGRAGSSACTLNDLVFKKAIAIYLLKS